MQRILQRGEIESLDHTSIPRVRMPQRLSIFADRAARLRHLAADHPASDYLLLMACLVEAQHRVLQDCPVAPSMTEQQIAMAQQHGMPPFQALGHERSPQWRDVLLMLLSDMLKTTQIPDHARFVMTTLQARVHEDPDGLESLADAILAERDEDVQGELAPFVMAALQVYWTNRVVDFDSSQLPVSTPFGLCPLCGSLPVSSVIRVGGLGDGCRYLCCSLCSTEWHRVTVTCTHCESNQSILYHFVEDGPQAIKAESCDECHSYRKIFYQEKDPHVDPVADDMASIALDVLMGEAGYSRASGNPLLWQGTEQ